MTEAGIQASTDSTLIRSEDGLAGYWNFDDETAKDLAVNDHDSELKGMPKLSVLPSLVMANRITNLDTNLSLMFLSRLGASTEQVYLVLLRVAQAIKWEANLKFSLRWNRMF